MSSGSFHMALFESRAARVARRTRENHANGRLLLAGANDLISGRRANAQFTDHSRADCCQLESARDGAAHPHLRAQAAPAPSDPRLAGGEAGAATDFPR